MPADCSTNDRGLERLVEDAEIAKRKNLRPELQRGPPGRKCRLQREPLAKD